MILVTVGTEQYPFNRLMQWVETLLNHDLIQEEIIVQYGTCTLLPTGAKVYKVLKEEQFQELIEQARVIIAHCGEGTVLLLDSFEKPFILVPRSHTFKEHIDNHQVEMALALADVDVPIAWSPADLVRFLANPQKVPVTNLSETTAQLLCEALQKRFGSGQPNVTLFPQLTPL
jgi:UDP-N-acetylglucosamine transferase subunit ALG13